MNKYNKNTNLNSKNNKFFPLPPTINFVRLLNKKELKHRPKYEYFVSLIFAEQIEQTTYVKVSNAFLRKVIRQEMIKRIKENLFDMGLIECDNQKRFTRINGKTVGLESFGYRIMSPYYVPHNQSVSCDKKIEPPNKHKTPKEKIEPQNNNKQQTSYKIKEYKYINQLTTLIKKEEMDKCSIYNRDAFFEKIGISSKIDNINNSTYPNNSEGCGGDKKFNKGRDAFLKKVVKAHYTRWDYLVKKIQHPEYKFIQENAMKLGIDSTVYVWIEEQVKNKMKLKPTKREFINSNGIPVTYLKKDRILSTEIAEQWKYQVKKIENGMYKFSCPSSINRVYYNVTLMPSVLRKFLRYEGKPLVQLDYSSFQPFLFIKFLLEKHKNNLPMDVISYIKLTSNGTFYAEIKKIIKEKKIEIKNEDTFKLDFFKRVFFSKEKRKDKFRTAFSTEFPNVAAMITEKKSHNYKNLPIGLQKLEAEIIINTILHELAKKYPTSFVLPVHDALICERSISEIVKKMMLEKTKQIIGFEPTLKEEILIH